MCNFIVIKNRGVGDIKFPYDAVKVFAFVYMFTPRPLKSTCEVMIEGNEHSLYGDKLCLSMDVKKAVSRTEQSTDLQ